ncbi:MAG: choice-of-anchor B family protein, partial [Bacteroidia bacterium]|nr:choice-of-anchor B family protein [Bacteroidia bacterium]
MKIKNALLSLTAIFSFATISVAQNLNVTLQAHLPYTGYTCANICGYVDTANNEYALVGSSQGLSIVNVTNPNTPISVFQHTGPTGSQALWQEIKVRGKYAYVTTEAGGGLQIFNLSTLPNASGITMHSYTGDGTIAGQLNSIHALHIEGNYAYLYGSNLFNGGAIAVNLTDPWNPIYEGHYSIGVSNNDSYVHDGYVRNDTLYAGHIYTGRCSVVDFTDKANPIELANFNTPNNFTHNTWLSSDSKTLFTTDEVDDSYLTSYDISDIGNITELDRIQSNPGSNSMVHNTHIISVGGNDYAVTSWYKDGFTIVDAGRPHNLIQVANYDTYSGTGGGSVGAWGVFPYFPSGTIVVSNINEGLFVFSPNYVRACYLEGNVTDSITGLPISNASIEILTTTAFDNSKLSGEYATGVPSPGGTYSVQYSKAGYVTKIISGISLSAGQVALQDVQLAPLTAFALSGKVVEQGTSTGIPNAHVRINSPIYDYQTTADANGNFTLPAVYADNYSLTAGKWGFVTNCSQTQTINPSSFITIELEKGYYDDFTFNFNWTTSGS